MIESRDFQAFSNAYGGAWESVGRNITARALNHAFELLSEYELKDIKRALVVHARASRNPPTPADIIDILSVGHRMSADEAWALALRAADESDTVVWTDIASAAWVDVSEIYRSGDAIGARVAFREAYKRHESAASLAGRGVTWLVSEGFDPQLRLVRVDEAIQAGRLPSKARERFVAALSGPADAIPALTHAAKLLSREKGKESVAADARKAISALAGIRSALSGKTAAPEKSLAEVERESFERKKAECLEAVERKLSEVA